jgi:hypothetical protein
MKKTKHERILEKREKQKSQSLDRIASKLLKTDEQVQKMKKYNLGKNPLDFF